MERNDSIKPVYRDGERNFKERFQFIYSVNDNIICQRYFKINGFIIDSVNSLELKEAIDECVMLLKDDLKSKSRVYMWYNSSSPVQMTGFDGRNEKTWLEYPENAVTFNEPDEKLNPYDVTFNFKFMMDNKVVYEYIWDGTCYPKYVRNSVDITNSGSSYRDRDQTMLSYSQSLNKAMTYGRMDLSHYIIKRICEAMSGDPERKYTKYDIYDNVEGHFEDGKFVHDVITDCKEYAYNSYNKKYVNEWRKHTMKKTLDYFDGTIPSKN